MFFQKRIKGRQVAPDIREDQSRLDGRLRERFDAQFQFRPTGEAMLASDDELGVMQGKLIDR